MSVPDELLRLRNLTIRFGSVAAAVTAANEVGLSVRAGRITALVGESGSGKSATALATMDLLGKSGRVEKGEIWLNGTELRSLPPRERKAFRGRDMAMIFQDPANALNPVLTIGRQLTETIRRHRPVSRAEAKRIAVSQLERAGLPDAESLLPRYSFQLSGGMCQRIMIALALLSGAKLLIADEPTTALDVSVQAQILRELHRVSREEKVGILLITHDLGVVAELADDVYVMRSGRILEYGDVISLFDHPQHPYTRKLLNSRL